MLTKEERKSTAIAKKLAAALVEIEEFWSDPEMVITDAEIYLSGTNRAGQYLTSYANAKQALQSLKRYYLTPAEARNEDDDAQKIERVVSLMVRLGYLGDNANNKGQMRRLVSEALGVERLSPEQEVARIVSPTAHGDAELISWLLNAARDAGDFVKNLAEAGLRADGYNYPILRPVLLRMKAKYPIYEHKKWPMPS
jgi:hypothetical protein